MRLPLDKVMEKLGVGRVLAPYETQPWFLYDEEKGITCSAEVRMGPDNEHLEAEIQFLHDEKEDEDEEGGDGDEGIFGPEQILIMRIRHLADGKWNVNYLHIRNEDYENKVHEWEEKGCDFFRACIESIQMGDLPDVDMLIDRELSDDMFGGGKSGKIGRKSPKIKPESMLGMKKGF